MGKSKELAELGDVVTQSGGNVGIGVSNPSTPLEITANAGANALRIRARSGDDYGFINYYSNDGSTRWAEIYSSSNKDISFTTDGTGSVKFKVDASGRVTMPYQAGFAAYSPATGTGGQNAIVYGSTYHNIGNHYNTSTGIFTAPIAGRYLFTASCLFNYSSGAYHRLDFRLNGSVYNSYGETLENQAGPSYSSATISNIFTLNANDTMQMWNGSNTTTYGSSYGHFSGIMLA